jgi:hypothetical protein
MKSFSGEALEWAERYSIKKVETPTQEDPDVISQNEAQASVTF